MTQPQCWKDEKAQLFARSLGVSPTCYVCRPCRDDIGRVIKSTEYVPRWDKRERVAQQCSIPNCEQKSFTCTRMTTEQGVQGILQNHGLPSNMSESTQLCKAHYYLIYNTLQPFPTCVTCQTRLKSTNARPCPNPSIIEKYLRETTNFEGSITEGDKVCYPCYKSHTVLLKQTKPASTDDELESIICVTNQKISQIQVHTSDDAVHRAMLSTTTFVAENLLNYQVLLLPSVHDFFTQQVRGIMQAFNLEGVENVHQLVTSQWILSNLIATLEHHMTVCAR